MRDAFFISLAVVGPVLGIELAIDQQPQRPTDLIALVMWRVFELRVCQ